MNNKLKSYFVVCFYCNRVSLDRRAWTKWGLGVEKIENHLVRINILIKHSKIQFITTIQNKIHLLRRLVWFITSCVILTTFPVCFMLSSCWLFPGVCGWSRWCQCKRSLGGFSTRPASPLRSHSMIHRASLAFPAGLIQHSSALHTAAQYALGLDQDTP